MRINKDSPIDFKFIQEFSFTHLYGVKNNYSYQLNLIHGFKEITLFTDEKQALITETGEKLAKLTGIPLNTEFKPA